MTSRRRIAVVGGGISGCAAAWVLSRQHDVTMFEAQPHLGGHSDHVELPGEAGSVDMGVMGVGVGLASANLSACMAELGVAFTEKPMTMGADLGAGLVWTNADHGAVSGLRDRFRPEIRRLRDAITDVTERPLEEMAGMPISHFLRAMRFSAAFVDQMVDPLLRMAFFNTDPLNASLAMLVLAVEEGLLSLDDAPLYRRVVGGSRSLFDAFAAQIEGHIHCGRPVRSVRRTGTEIEVGLEDGEGEAFDDVVFAVTSDQVLQVLHQPTDTEQTVLQGLLPEPVHVILHRDASVLGTGFADPPVLQVVDDPTGQRLRHFDVGHWLDLETTGPVIMSSGDARVEPGSVVAERQWVVSALSPYAAYCRSFLPQIQGVGGLWYCGQGYTMPYYEESFVSGLVVAQHLGVPLPFAGNENAGVLQRFVNRMMGNR